MKKTDAVVKRETKYIALFVLLLSAVMEAIFAVSGYWSFSVLLGNLLGGAIAVLNFFLMGLTVQKAVTQEEKEAKKTIRVSQSSRLLMLTVTAALGYFVPVFNIIAVLVPLFFPRIAIAVRPLIDKEIRNDIKKSKESTDSKDYDNDDGEGE